MNIGLRFRAHLLADAVDQGANVVLDAAFFLVDFRRLDVLGGASDFGALCLGQSPGASGAAFSPGLGGGDRPSLGGMTKPSFPQPGGGLGGGNRPGGSGGVS